MAPALPRVAATRRFYRLLAQLELRIGARRRLMNVSAGDDWSERGLYFVFERGERRSLSGYGPRVVRSGAHAVGPGDRTTLLSRLLGHRGSLHPPGGDHRASQFRAMVGEALIARTPGLDCATWGTKAGAGPFDTDLGPERRLERLVSRRIRNMTVLVLPVGDSPESDARCAHVARQCIALLDGSGGDPLDPPSAFWLGRHCPREQVRLSGLWNEDLPGEPSDPGFPDALADLVAPTASRAPPAPGAT